MPRRVPVKPSTRRHGRHPQVRQRFERLQHTGPLRMRKDNRPQLLILRFSRNSGLFNGRPVHEPLPEAVDDDSTGDGSAIYRAQCQRAQFAQIESQRGDVDQLVFPDAFHNLGGFFRWSGMVSDPNECIAITELIAKRQLDPFAREIILTTHEIN